MADNGDYSEYDEDTTEESRPKNGLRAQLESALAEKKELEAQLQALKSESRQRALSETLAAKGLHPKIASLIPADVADGEGVDAWLAEFGEAFGVKTAPEGEAAAPAETAPAVPAEEVAASKKLQNLSATAQTPDLVGNVSNELRNANSTEEIQAAWRKARESFL